jgi:FlaG/FlaF family flagellin (archaellin)
MIQYKDAAVSPVVGVMLMLVVTIIIAAVVSSFAGGLAGSTPKTPQASIVATVTLPPYGNQTVFAHNGGDTFDLKDIKVVFQSGDTKTTLTLNDLNVTASGNNAPNCLYFYKVGDTTGSTMIKPGDSFVIVGSNDQYVPFSMDLPNTLDYGSFSMSADTKITWSVIDKASGGTISTGTVVL